VGQSDALHLLIIVQEVPSLQANRPLYGPYSNTYRLSTDLSGFIQYNPYSSLFIPINDQQNPAFMENSA